MKIINILIPFLFCSIITLSAQDSTSRIDSTETTFCNSSERMSEYPGGVSKLLEFIDENLTWPPLAYDLCLEGRFFIVIKIERTGEISNIRVLRSLHEDLDAEAIRVVKLMPKWIPAENYKGEKMESFWTIPFQFKITK